MAFASFTNAGIRQERYDRHMPLPRLDRPGDFIDGAFRNIAPADGELRVESPADTNDLTAV
jgi:hypothetical protein